VRLDARVRDETSHSRATAAACPPAYRGLANAPPCGGEKRAVAGNANDRALRRIATTTLAAARDGAL